VIKCDLTHKPQYFDGKLESGGGSHEMKEITVSTLYMGKDSDQGIYNEHGSYGIKGLRMAHTRRFEIQLPTGRKCTMTVVLPPCPRCLNNVKSVSIAIHKDSIAQITCISSHY